MLQLQLHTAVADGHQLAPAHVGSSLSGSDSSKVQRCHVAAWCDTIQSAFARPAAHTQQLHTATATIQTPACHAFHKVKSAYALLGVLQGPC